jgi:hypothetical protein
LGEASLQVVGLRDADRISMARFGISMARFKLFPRYRRPSLGELLGISQSSRQVSRKHHLRIVLDRMSLIKNAQRRAKRRSGYYSPPMLFARFLRRLFH